MAFRLALKIDVDTDRGTRLGVPNLVADCHAVHAPACFLFSLGPDNTGKAIRRIFRPGFFAKVSRTNIVQHYGLRTLLNGTLLPAPHIGRRNAALMREVRDAGFECGIHCHDHIRWQDHLHELTPEQIRTEFSAARGEFRRIFGCEALTAGAAGWQSSAASRTVYDEAGLLYGSDTRGAEPFFPRVAGHIFKTLEIPTTLPTLDELMGRPEYPDRLLASHLLSLLRPDRLNVFTLHAELEGLRQREVFREFLLGCVRHGTEFVRLEDVARTCLAAPKTVPVCELVQAPIDGRSGLLATQGAAA
ncbi:MAG: polysaccharide deacetylase [Lacunisphaera sp.]|nr:polysaccharide deacetylase [Lacunisphaera sp.]